MAEALDGLEAVEKAQQLKPDVILMGHRPPRPRWPGGGSTISLKFVPACIDHERQHCILFQSLLKTEQALRFGPRINTAFPIEYHCPS